MARLPHRALLTSVTLVTGVALATLAGCGSDDSSATDPASDSPAPTSSTPSDTPSSTPPTSAAPDLPDCASVWVAGQALPKSYRGCLDDGNPVKAKKHACSDGSLIIEFDNQFYASAGQAINQVPDLAKSQQYRSALAACQA